MTFDLYTYKVSTTMHEWVHVIVATQALVHYLICPHSPSGLCVHISDMYAQARGRLWASADISGNARV